MAKFVAFFYFCSTVVLWGYCAGSVGKAVHSARAHLSESVYGLVHCATFGRCVLEAALLRALLLDGGLPDFAFGQSREGTA